MLRALIFDFDGLILDTETALIDAYGDVHADHGVAFDRPLFARSVGHADYAFDPWRAFGPGADRGMLERERIARRQERVLALSILPGVLDLIADGRSRGLAIGLASNSSHAHVDGHIGRLGIAGHFDTVACREDAASPKPEPDLYRLVLNRLGLRPADAVAFEDSHTGTLAARRAHLWVVAVPNPSTAHHDFSNAHLRLPSLADCRLADLASRFGP